VLRFYENIWTNDFFCGNILTEGVCNLSSSVEILVGYKELPFYKQSSAVGQGSSVSIVTSYRLDGLVIYSLLGQDFSAPSQTGPGAHPASCPMGTVSLSQG
jgi:hypothetical protein